MVFLTDLRRELVLCIPAHVKLLKKLEKCPVCSRGLQDKIDWFAALEQEVLKDIAMEAGKET